MPEAVPPGGASDRSRPAVHYAEAVQDAVVAAFAPAGDSSRAPGMAAYMRHQFPFLGLAGPAREALGRAVMAELPPLDEASLTSAARACWALTEREYQYFAVRLLRRHVRMLTPRSVPILEQLITTKAWWDTVDELAVHVVGFLAVGYRRELRDATDAWIEAEGIWLARTAILHQVRYGDRTDARTLFRYCLCRGHDQEFFIRKAIGWALREYSKTDPVAVRRFVTANTTRLAPLSRREALRLL